VTNVSLTEVGTGVGIVASLVGIDAWARNRHLAKQDNKLEEIHVLVNSRLTEALDRIESLEEALHLATGIPKEMIQKDEVPPTATPTA
jgi:hypothetical protein